jgi:RNA polymerase sigma-70 factor (ECF subfamily)
MDLAFSSSSSSLSALTFGSSLPATWTVEPAPVSGPRVSAEPLVAQPALTEAQSEDAALLEGLLNNDRAAWRTFETRYGRLILSCIARVTSRFVCVRPDDVREIQATLYLELISNDKKKLRSFEQNRGTRFGTWLGLLATHTAYDFLRRARRDSKCDGIEGAEALRADTPDPSDYTLVRERAALVARLLDTLSAKDRQFVELYYAEGLPAEEVAERMQISVKTVYTKKHKLQGRLESLLGKSRVAA